MINQKSSWPVIDEARKAQAAGKPLPPSIFAAIADRLRSALDASDASKIRSAAEQLELLYRDMTAGAPASVQAASRGEKQDDIATGYELGKVAFAQLLAARVADTRGDARFFDHLTDVRYRPYIEALQSGPLSSTALAKQVNERSETVSRKLGDLRTLGIIGSRKQGNVLVSMLTPAAMAALDRPISAKPAPKPMPEFKSPEVQEQIQKKNDGLPGHMQSVPRFSKKAA